MKERKCKIGLVFKAKFGNPQAGYIHRVFIKTDGLTGWDEAAVFRQQDLNSIPDIIPWWIRARNPTAVIIEIDENGDPVDKNFNTKTGLEEMYETSN